MKYHTFACLALTTLIAILLLNISETQAMSYLERKHCDYIFSEYAFTQIDRSEYPRCEKRFDYLTKRYFTNNYR